MFNKLFGWDRGSSCDNCQIATSPEKSYLLTTSQVVSSEAFWERMLKDFPSIQQKDPAGDNWATYVGKVAESRTPWQICENCISLFEDVNKDAAKKYSLKNTRPPGSGPSDLRASGLAAAYAWAKLYQCWPKSMFVGRAPITHDETKGVVCDFCSRIVTDSEEGFAIISPKIIQEFEREAKLTHTASAPQHNKDGKPRYPITSSVPQDGIGLIKTGDLRNSEEKAAKTGREDNEPRYLACSVCYKRYTRAN